MNAVLESSSLSTTKWELLPQTTFNQNDCIADMVFCSKIRIENPGACTREYNSIMQIVMESLIGWDFSLGKQTSKGIFEEVLG
jgi:hypothetical protein